MSIANLSKYTRFALSAIFLFVHFGTTAPAASAEPGPVSALLNRVTDDASPQFVVLFRWAATVFAVDHDYSKALDLFIQAQAASDRDADFALAWEYINASLYALKKNRLALEALCRDRDRLRSAGLDLMFDIHAHVRAIVLRDGYEVARRMVRDFRAQCGMPEFSEVWVAVPLAKMEYLKRQVHVLHEGYTLPNEDRFQLEQIIREKPDDLFIDYANYFLHRFPAIRLERLAALHRKLHWRISRRQLNYPFCSAPWTSETLISGKQTAVILNNDIEHLKLNTGNNDSTINRRDLNGPIKFAVCTIARAADPREIDIFISQLHESTRNHLRNAFRLWEYLQDRRALLETISSIDARSKMQILNSIEKSVCDTPEACLLLAQYSPNQIFVAQMFLQSMKWNYRYDRSPVYIEGMFRAFTAFAERGAVPMLIPMGQRYERFLADIRELPRSEKDLFLRVFFRGSCPNDVELTLCFSRVKSMLTFPEREDVIRSELRRLACLGDTDALFSIYETAREIFGFPSRLPNDMSSFEDKLEVTRTYLRANDLDALFSFAVQLKGRIFKNGKKEGLNSPCLAAIIYQYVARNARGTALGENAHYLYITTERYRTQNLTKEELEGLLRDFIAIYPESHFIDDAYAEIGLIYKEMHYDEKEAGEIFKTIVEQFPDRNAADNAAYFLYKMSIRQRDFLGAVRYATFIAKQFADGRINHLLPHRRAELEGATRALDDRKDIDGLVVTIRSDGATVVWIDSSKISSMAPVSRGDQLSEINGRAVGSDVGFYNILANLKVGERIELVFETLPYVRDSETGESRPQRVTAVGRISQAKYFDVAFVEMDDVLNVRESPGWREPKVGELQPDATCVRLNGGDSSAVRTIGRSRWFKIWHRDDDGSGVSGWVNRRFLVRSKECFE